MKSLEDLRASSSAFHLRAASAADAESLAPRLRAADRREATALGFEPAAALRNSVEGSSRAWTASLAEDPTGAPIALFGVGSAPGRPDIGAPWLLGADAMAQRPRAVLRLATSLLPEIAAGYSLLVNRADARNHMHLAWVRRLGFRCLRRVRLGPERREFVEFAMLVSPSLC